MIVITGDKHRDFEYLLKVSRITLEDDDTIVILGDAGINVYLDESDEYMKSYLNKELGCNLLIIQGNHERYAGMLGTYDLEEYLGGEVYVEAEYPKLKFAKNGSIFKCELDGEVRNIIALGGANSIGSVDFREEVVLPEERKYIIDQLDKYGSEIDYVFAHTCPEGVEPKEYYLPGVQVTDNNSVGKFYSLMRGKMPNLITWYYGHFHGDKSYGEYRLVYDDFIDMETGFTW